MVYLCYVTFISIQTIKRERKRRKQDLIIQGSSECSLLPPPLLITALSLACSLLVLDSPLQHKDLFILDPDLGLGLDLTWGKNVIDSSALGQRLCTQLPGWLILVLFASQAH